MSNELWQQSSADRMRQSAPLKASSVCEILEASRSNRFNTSSASSESQQWKRRSESVQLMLKLE